MSEILIVADDLTGAADSAVPFAGLAGTAVVLDGGGWPDAEVVAVDTDSRYASEPVAVERVVRAVARGRADGARIVKKIDSTLRGHVGAEIAAASGRGVLAVVAPAFPALGRTVRGGLVHVDGEPLHGGDVTAMLAKAGLRVLGIALDELRAPNLSARFTQARADGVHAVVCDSETDQDLLAVCNALSNKAILLAGSGGVTAALARTLGPPRPAETAAPDGPELGDEGMPLAGSGALGPPRPAKVAAPDGPALVVVGSYSATAREQRAELVAQGVTPVNLPPGGGDLAMPVKAIREAFARGADVVLSPNPEAPVDPDQAFDTARSLAIVAAASRAGILLATGGETARAVLHELGATELWPLGEPQPGVVAARIPGVDTLFITKAGAFGRPATLVRVLRAIRGE